MSAFENNLSLPPLPSTPIPDSAIKLLQLAAHWVALNFDPADEQPMMPGLLRIDHEGQGEMVMIPLIRPEDKPKLGRLIQQQREFTKLFGSWVDGLGGSGGHSDDVRRSGR